jgi:hypothetical protein
MYDEYDNEMYWESDIDTWETNQVYLDNEGGCDWD